MNPDGKVLAETIYSDRYTWLRFLGRLQEQQPDTPPFGDLVQRFDRYLREERGQSPHTIHNRCWHVQAFLCWLSEQGSSNPSTVHGRATRALPHGCRTWAARFARN
ncbi:site-specific integrase [Paraburkholderia sp. Clong3]|uniref:site-specific integrase n=1 Tax=Paraburkholderia sp. Clong3 TaxID=2991061 RepID=UPI003D237266